MMLFDFGRMFSVGTIHLEDIVPAKQGGIEEGGWGIVMHMVAVLAGCWLARTGPLSLDHFSPC